MGQFVEASGRIPDDIDLLRSHVGALSQRLPGSVKTPLHFAAPLTCSNVERGTVENSPSPLMSEVTAHD